MAEHAPNRVCNKQTRYVNQKRTAIMSKRLIREKVAAKRPSEIQSAERNLEYCWSDAARRKEIMESKVSGPRKYLGLTSLGRQFNLLGELRLDFRKPLVRQNRLGKILLESRLSRHPGRDASPLTVEHGSLPRSE